MNEEMRRVRVRLSTTATTATTTKQHTHTQRIRNEKGNENRMIYDMIRMRKRKAW